MPDAITFEDFIKLDIRVGEVLAAERVPETDKLIKCRISFGDLGERTIVSGVALYKTPEEMIGKKLLYIVNLAPRVIKGIESQGMLLALSHGENNFSFIVPEGPDVPAGTRAK
ncbi:MAG: methionine--tRNA ligase subunit beta [Patescibacteria group bacterium]